MRSPRITDRFALSASRRPAGFFFKFQQHEIVEVLTLEFPRCCQSRNTAADDNGFYCLPIIRWHFEIPVLSENMSKVDALTDDLAVRKVARFSKLASCHCKRRAEEECQKFPT